MNIDIAVILSKAFTCCPKCESKFIGNGVGRLVIDENEFIMGCKCGYEIKILIQEKEVV